MLKKLSQLDFEQFSGRTRRWEKQWVPCMRGLGEGGEVRCELIRWIPTDDASQPVLESRHPHLKPFRNASSKLYLQPHSTLPGDEQEQEQHPDAQGAQGQQQCEEQQQQPTSLPRPLVPMPPPASLSTPPQLPQHSAPPRPPQPRVTKRWICHSKGVRLMGKAVTVQN